MPLGHTYSRVGYSKCLGPIYFLDSPLKGHAQSPEADEANVGVHSTVGVVNGGKGRTMCNYRSSCYLCCFARIERPTTIIIIMNRSDC